MKSLTKTDRIFSAIRELPDEMPLEKVQQFVLAQAALGITFAAAPKAATGIKALLFKFHLNTIIAMASIATTSVVGFLLFTGWHNEKNSIASFSEPKDFSFTNKTQQTFSPPEISLPADSPVAKIPDAPAATSTVKVSNGKTIIVTGTNLNVVAYNENDSVSSVAITSMPEKNASDSAEENAYSYAYDYSPPAIEKAKHFSFSKGDSYSPSICSTGSCSVNYVTLPNAPCAPNPACGFAVCSHSDSLLFKLEDQLIKDGLITDKKHFTFRIDGNSLKINGARQSKEVFQSYKNFIETHSHNIVNRKFLYSVTSDGDGLSIDMENYNTD